MIWARNPPSLPPQSDYERKPFQTWLQSLSRCYRYRRTRKARPSLPRPALLGRPRTGIGCIEPIPCRLRESIDCLLHLNWNCLVSLDWDWEWLFFSEPLYFLRWLYIPWVICDLKFKHSIKHPYNQTDQTLCVSFNKSKLAAENQRWKMWTITE